MTNDSFFSLVASSFVLCCCCWSASSITPWPSDWVVVNNSSLPTSDGYFKTIHGPFRQVIDATGTPITSNSSASFELGFVDLASSGAFLLVIGMSMGMSSPGIEVWSANRGRPVRENAQLRIGPAGNLLLQDADGSAVWDSGTGLVDSLEIDGAGDLSLFNSSSTVWRSFLHPTDSLLQGQIFSQGFKLVSNSSLTNTSEGAYSLVMEPAGLVLYFNSTPSERLPYWSRTFPGYDYQSLDSPCLVKSSTQAVFVGFSIELSGELSPNSSDSCLPPNSTSVSFATTMATDEFYFVRLDMDGNLRNYKQTTTVPFNGTNMQWAVDFELFPSGTSSQCALPNVCGPYGVCNKGLCSCPGSGTPDAFPQLNDLDSRAGCKPPRTLACDNKHHYLRLQGVDYFLNAFSAPEPNVSSVEQCSALCSSNCSCEAFFFHDHTHACFRTRNLQSLLTAPNSSFSAYLKLQNVTVPTSPGKPLSKGAIAGIVVSASLGLILCSALATTMVYRIARQGFLDPDEEEERRFLEALPGLPPRFSLRELRQATQDFKRKLGGGGFGSVYAGVLGDGTQVAVKRLDRATQGHKEFRAEVATIGSISHVNLVCLRGFCAEKGQRLLVYELMDNLSLDKWLYPAAAEDGARFLTWEQRVSIAIGAAKGLVYLHEECREPIIHLDIKPQNILLDRNLEAKLADFGLARLMDRDVSEVVTAVRGTPGYLAPELAGMSIATSKCDVFSYGVVLLELVAGRRGLDRALVEVEPSRCHLPTWAKLMVLEGRTMEVVDPRLCLNTQSSSPENQQAAASLIHLALLCVQQQPGLRPSMSTVLKMLQTQEPIPPITDQPHESKQGLDSSASSLAELGLMSQSSQNSTVPFPELLSGPR